MALSTVEVVKGLGSLAFFDYDDHLPKYLLQSASEFSITAKVEKDQLKNSARGVLDEDIRETEYEMKFTAYEYPATVIEHLTGGSKTTNALNASGEVIEFLNVLGTSVKSATTGIASIGVTTASQLKVGYYVIKATSTTAVAIYATSDVSFKDGAYDGVIDDNLLITTSAGTSSFTISTGTSTGVGGFGIELIGGSGTIGMTVNDTAIFRVRRASKAGWKIDIGGVGTEDENVKCIAYAKKKNDTYRAVKIHRVMITGMPIEMSDAYSKYEVSATLQYDSTAGCAFSVIKE